MKLGTNSLTVLLIFVSLYLFFHTLLAPGSWVLSPQPNPPLLLLLLLFCNFSVTTTDIRGRSTSVTMATAAAGGSDNVADIEVSCVQHFGAPLATP